MKKIENYLKEGASMKRNIATVIAGIGILASLSFPTPSTQVWNPGTDVQAAGTYHFGIDNYYNATSAFATDLGLTYGAIKGLEVGVDLFYPNPVGPFSFNAKYSIDEGTTLPAVAVGVTGIGLSKDDANTDYREIYGVIAKTFGPIGRFSGGYFTANSNVVGADNTGFILTWDKSINDKIWACVDIATGASSLGSTFAGFSYNFAANTSVLFGIGKFNTATNPCFTTQLDINI